jgi:hypothetical protein
MSEVGYITNVTVQPDAGQVLVSVSVSPRRNRADIRFLTTGQGTIEIPQEGDIVEVKNIQGENVATRPFKTEERTLPDNASPGDIILQNEDGYGVAVKPDGTIKLYGTAVDVHTDGETL